MPNIACFDVGGTFIKCGIVNEQGEIKVKDKFKSPTDDWKNTLPGLIIRQIDEFKKQYELESVGISTTGTVDTKKGTIIFASDNTPGYTGTNLSETIKKKTGLNCFVENDVNAVALGELWRGAGKDLDMFVCVALGTGIGGAIIINKKLYKGMREGAGELGHMVINRYGEKCKCGSAGCYERYGATSALVRNYAEIKNLRVEDVSGDHIIKKVKEGDLVAIKVYDDFLNAVVTGLVNITHILDPGIIIVGGGISAQGKTLFNEINKRFKQAVMPSYGEYTRIVQAKLENDAGLLGACYAALNN